MTYAIFDFASIAAYVNRKPQSVDRLDEAYENVYGGPESSTLPPCPYCNSLTTHIRPSGNIQCSSCTAIGDPDCWKKGEKFPKPEDFKRVRHFHKLEGWVSFKGRSDQG